MRRHIIHLHIPSFPIAVARVCRPALRDCPVAVAPPHSERAVILSVSFEARKEGVFKGMPLSTAMKLCPGLTALPPDPGLTERACRAMAEVVGRYTPLWEPSRPGHIYLDVTGTERLWGRARDTGCRLRKEIKARLYLAGTAGVAGNKMVSSIASRITPSLEVLDVDQGREASFMAPLKVGMVPGIGRFRRKILLEELNIFRVRDLAALDMGALKLIFGRQAHVIHQRTLGIDPTPVYPVPQRPMVSEEITLPQDENDDQRLLAALYGLTERCSYRLRTRELIPRKAGLLIRYSDQMEARRQIRLPHTMFRDFDLYGPLEELFLTLCNRRVRVRFIRVWFLDFSAPDRQLSLFSAPSPLAEKQSAVIQALDRIRERYGEEGIGKGIRYEVEFIKGNPLLSSWKAHRNNCREALPHPHWGNRKHKIGNFLSLTLWVLVITMYTLWTLFRSRRKTMRARVVRIGNSQGIRIPKPLLEQTGIMDDVELEVEKNQIIIRPVPNPREGWDNAFKTMAQKGDDTLIYGDENISHSWDEEEWQW